jgi:hypothetical protein
MAIALGKKRYQVTLTPSVVERFQALAKDIGLPPSVMSAACEDALKGISEVFQTAKEKGSLEISDLYRLMGQQLELIEIERREDEKAKNQMGKLP